MGRVVVGAACGALLTLLAHPLSRPFLIGAVSSGKLLQVLESPAESAPAPTSRLEAAQWVQVAAEKIAADHSLTKREIVSARQVAAEGLRRDPTNAFWSQMLAVFDRQAGDRKAALKDWMRGASATVWNDLQTERLMRQRDELSEVAHESQGWQFAYLYHRRSLAVAQLIEREARYFLSSADYFSPESLQIRYSTVMNGARLRDGSRNDRVGQIGADIVELGAYPSELSGRRNPKKPLLGQNELFSSLLVANHPEWARNVQSEFNQNQSWLALSNVSHADDEARDLGLASLTNALLPSVLLIVGMIGLAIWGLGILCEKLFGSRRTFGWVVPGLLALLLGGSVQVLTTFPIAAVAAALCGGFLAATPAQQRKAKQPGFGPTFGLIIGLLAIACGASLAAFLFGYSTPAIALLPLLGVPPEYFGGSPLFIGLAILFFSMLFLVTPFWAMVQRQATPYVFCRGLQRFGSTLTLGSMFAVVIGGPVAIYADQRSSEKLYQLMANEPIYYQLYYRQQNAHRT